MEGILQRKNWQVKLMDFNHPKFVKPTLKNDHDNIKYHKRYEMIKNRSFLLKYQAGNSTTT